MVESWLRAQLLEDVLNEEIAAVVVAPRALEAAIAEGEVVRRSIVVSDLEHPVRPVGRVGKHVCASDREDSSD
eukprot:153880-Prymnesium_polylepis.2